MKKNLKNHYRQFHQSQAKCAFVEKKMSFYSLFILPDNEAKWNMYL